MFITQPDIFNYTATDTKFRTKTLNEIQKVCNRCYKCELSKSRTKVVFGEGNPRGKILLIGEAPGRQEDKTGSPFVGRAGKLLDKFLEAEGLSREKDIYISNIVKCRPPQNRTPKIEEIAACRVYLESQIRLIRPQIIILAGSTAIKGFMENKTPISKIRGQWLDGPFGSKVMPIFHPSYLLRYNSIEKGSPRWLMQQDIKEIKNTYCVK